MEDLYDNCYFEEQDTLWLRWKSGSFLSETAENHQELLLFSKKAIKMSLQTVLERSLLLLLQEAANNLYSNMFLCMEI